MVGLKSVIRRKRPNYIRSTPEVTAQNILNRHFIAETLNEKWLSDVTEFKYGDNGKIYLSAILDLKDKSIISYAVGRSNNNQLVFDTFDAAVRTVQPLPQKIFVEALLRHSVQRPLNILRMFRPLQTPLPHRQP